MIYIYIYIWVHSSSGSSVFEHVKVSCIQLHLGLFFVMLDFHPKTNNNNKKHRKQKKQRKPKKTKKTLGKTKKQSFLRFQTSPWIWVCFFLFFGFSNVFMVLLQKPKNIGKTKKNQRKPKKTKKTLGKTKKPKFFKVSDLPLDMGLVFLVFWFFQCFFGFPSFAWENQKTKKTKPISKGRSETLKNFGFLVFPNVFLVFFGFLWFFWFFLCFLIFATKPKNIEKTITPKKPNPYPRGGLKP